MVCHLLITFVLQSFNDNVPTLECLEFIFLKKFILLIILRYCQFDYTRINIQTNHKFRSLNKQSERERERVLNSF